MGSRSNNGTCEAIEGLHISIKNYIQLLNKITNNQNEDLAQVSVITGLKLFTTNAVVATESELFFSSFCSINASRRLLHFVTDA